MKNTTVSVNTNLDKNFVEYLLSTLKKNGDKVDAQYLCSAPSTPVKNKEHR